MKRFLFITILLLILLPSISYAQYDSEGSDSSEAGLPDQTFEAEIINVIEQKEITREDGSKGTVQKLKLMGLDGEWKDKEIIFDGFAQVDIFQKSIYNKGDKVIIDYLKDQEGKDNFFIIDFVRRGYLYLLAILFSISIVLVGRMKGLKSLISLIVSFFIILKFVIPFILNGTSPIIVGLLGSFAILAVIIYLTEGFNYKSHLALVSVFFSLLLTFILSVIFSNLTQLTGLSQEESLFLVGIDKNLVDFKGLLLAGILIGTAGVLDDIIIGQIEAVKQLKEANPSLKKMELFRSAFKIGNTHLGAIINTLFLTYTGASLPLLLLFSMDTSVSASFGKIINNEAIATEIVRTLVGSIGLALSVPMSTFLAAWFYRDGRKGKIIRFKSKS